MKRYIILGIVIISITSIFLVYNEKSKINYINYNGFKLALSVDGESVNAMPTGKYFLVSYECSSGSTLNWDYETSTLRYDNINANDRCSLKFESSPKLYNLVNIGDYISYIGDSDNGCSDNQCKGWGNYQTNTNLYENYGYCNMSSYYRFTTYGWRVLYKEDNSVYIISASAPECIAITRNDNTQTISDLNTAALKYCNELYQSNGECNYDTAHPFNNDDFYKFTSGQYGAGNGRHLGSAYGSNHCFAKYGNTFCGYNNDIIDNGSYYWFGSKTSATDTQNVFFWEASSSSINSAAGGYQNGLRPVIKLDASILATGGKGTMEVPYTISERTIENS